MEEYLSWRQRDKKRATAIFAGIKKISFDFAVVEKLEPIHCLRAEFPWDDVGSWNALSRITQWIARKHAARGGGGFYTKAPLVSTTVRRWCLY